MTRRILALISVVAIVAGVAAAGYLLTRRSTTYPESQGNLRLISGSGTISTANISPVEVKQGQDHVVKVGDIVKVNGAAVLTLAGVEINLTSGTELEIKQANALDAEAQTELLLKQGQLLQRLNGYVSSRSSYSVTAGEATMTTRGGEFLTRLSSDGIVVVASNIGTATVKLGTKTLTIKDKQGITLPAGQVDGELPAPTPWSVFHLQTYRPDGSLVALPSMLTNEENNQQYDFVSNNLALIPEGVYTLRIQTLAPYEIKHVKLSADDDNPLQITLGETIFTVTDEKGNPQAYTALNVKGSYQTRILPDVPLLLGPGKTSLIVALEENADEIQPIEVLVAPGERTTTGIPQSLFGGGRIQLDLGTPNGTPIDPVIVTVYTSNNENGDPVANFKSDSVSPLLPAGDYIVSVKTQLAGRYLVTVPKNQTVTVAAPLSYLDIIYTDNQGKPINRNAFIYVASVTEISRLGLPIDQMRRTPYGLGLPLAATNRIIVPAGTYNIMIDDRKDVMAENVEVKAGQITPIELQALPG